MRPHGAPPPCPHVGVGAGWPLRNGALAAPREAFMHSNNRTAMKLQTALHSRSSTSRPRPRVRRRPERTEASSGRTGLAPMGDTGAAISPSGTRLASSAVMAGDESVEHPSVILKKRGAATAAAPAATSTAWRLGQSSNSNISSSSGSRGEGGGGTEERQQQHEQHARRGSENKEEKPPPCTQSKDVGAAAATPRKEVRLSFVVVGCYVCTIYSLLPGFHSSFVTIAHLAVVVDHVCPPSTTTSADV